MSEENPFKQLDGESEAPADLKEQVMGTIRSAQLLAGLADLFTFKAGRTLQELLEQIEPNSQAPLDD